jgi:hypothetical protein
MRCLFCKCPSEDATSVEHIVPESLGNRRHILPRGAICDRCNNYFSREVEGPLLSHPSMRNHRAWYQEPTKKGKLPSLLGVHLGSDIEINLRVAKDGDLKIGPYGITAERAGDKDRLLHTAATDEPYGGPGFAFALGTDPPQREMSRFLAKMALEALWLRLSNDSTTIKMLIDSEHHDRIRFWARRGDNFASWPFHQRRICPEESLIRHPLTNSWVRVGFGYNLFLTKRPETFFAFCLFGVEYVINLGGPSIKGYEEWLEENRFQSPLIEGVGMRLTARHVNGEVTYFLDS